MKRYKLVLVRDDIDNTCFIANSKKNSMFFENLDNYSNSQYYTVLSKVIVVEEDDLEEASIKLCNISDMNISDLEKKKLAVNVWAHYDFNFNHLTREEKENIVKDYIDAYFNS